MQTEKIQIIHYIPRYISQYTSSQSKEEVALAQVLEEIINRLSTNTYPNGQMVWEEVFKEEEQNLHLDREVFRIMVQAGNGLFGRSREENISFLEKSITELQQQQARLREKNLKERKVWIPVGMLGMLMLVILFI